MFDIVIIGGGVVGALTARELSKFKLKTLVVEREFDVATGASGANSGIVHGGFDAAEGSQKAKYNVLGNALMRATAQDLGVKFIPNGSLVLGFNEADAKTFKALQERGVKNKALPTEIIDAQRVLKAEPNVSADVAGALYAPGGGIVCPYELTIAAVGNAMDNGAALRLGFEVCAIERKKNGFCVISKNGERINCRAVINCAGLYSDKIAGLIGDKSFKIGARKGEYILLDRECKGFVKSTLFSCPDEKGKGVLVTPTVDGNILIGPTSVPSDDKEDNSVSPDSFDEIISRAKKMCPSLPLYNTITSFCGVRAFSDRHDFIIEHSKIDNRLINVAGIESPGLTAAPAIAQTVAQMATSLFDNVKINTAFNPVRKPDFFFKELTVEKKNELIKENPDFGKIVCRCEEVTLGEILFVLNRNPVAPTIDGVKRRTRAGMGRCQGSFCQPSVADILHSNCGLNYGDITKSGSGSWVFNGRIK